MSDLTEYYGDVLYEVWRNGGNPDAVDHSRVQDFYEGDPMWPDECAASELRHQRLGEPTP